MVVITLSGLEFWEAFGDSGDEGLGGEVGAAREREREAWLGWV